MHKSKSKNKHLLVQVGPDTYIDPTAIIGISHNTSGLPYTISLSNQQSYSLSEDSYKYLMNFVDLSSNPYYTEKRSKPKPKAKPKPENKIVEPKVQINEYDPPYDLPPKRGSYYTELNGPEFIEGLNRRLSNTGTYTDFNDFLVKHNIL